ncbi:MAG TPA: FAD-dependent oxidoreductase [Acidimicrobiales bacterium]|nr:FAD-dependent oxidoreductase [Acidimicrobiales bacterium]
MTDEFPYVFRPLRIGAVTVPNRLFVTAHATQFVEDDPAGYHRWSVLGDRARAYYEDRAKGGFGLQIIGQTQVHPQAGPDRPSSFAAEAVSRYRAIAEACHRHGSVVFVQLNHNGRERGSSGPDSWAPLWSASSLPAAHGEMTKAMDADDIAELVAAFARAATLCRDAGMDGVEVHAAHPHMLGEWLTSAYNRRDDAYGGTLVNRLRIVVEIVEAIRGACGSEFVVGVRTNGAWTMPGGHTPEEGVEIATRLASSVRLDFVDVSGVPTIGSIGTPFAGIVPWAEAVKRALPSLPVFGVGRIVRPEQAEAILARGDLDMVGMTRASIADPELPVKARTGRGAEVRVCIGAGQGCLMRNRDRRPLTCQQNPAVGRESEWGIGTLRAATSARRVVVVGGGPGGLEAAVAAAARGHDVTLLEREGELGGQVRFITRNERREEFARVVEWRAGELERLGARVVLGVEATADAVVAEGPDDVVVATGSRPRRDGWYPVTPHRRALPGFDLPHVVTTWAALTGACDAAAHVVIIDAHGYHHSSDVVEYLAARGVRTTVVTATPVLAAGVDDNDRPDLMRAIRDCPVELVTNTIVDAIGSDHVLAHDTHRGRERRIEDVDRVVLSVGQDPVDDLYRALEGRVDRLLRVGDCVAPRGVEHAVYEGHRAGREL